MRQAGAGARRRPFAGPADAVADDIAAFARLGVREIVFDFRSERLEESLDRMERFVPPDIPSWITPDET